MKWKLFFCIQRLKFSLGEMRISDLEDTLSRLNDLRVQPDPKIKTLYKQMFATNLQIMKDTNRQLYKQCEIFKGNMTHYEVLKIDQKYKEETKSH